MRQRAVWEAIPTGIPELGRVGLPSGSLAVGAGSCASSWASAGTEQVPSRAQGWVVASLHYLLLLTVKVTTAKWFRSLSASDIAVLITVALSARDYEEWEGTLIIWQTIQGVKRVFICPGLIATRLRFWVTEVQPQQQPSPIHPLASDTHSPYLSRRIICSRDQGLEKLYLISSLFFFKSSFPPHWAFLQLLHNPLQTISNLSVTGISRCPLSVVPSDDWQVSLSTTPQTTRLILLTGLHRFSLQSQKGKIQGNTINRA